MEMVVSGHRDVPAAEPLGTLARRPQIATEIAELLSAPERGTPERMRLT